MLKLSLVVLVVLFADMNYATSNTACDMCNITELMITPSYNITVPAGSTLALTCSSQVSGSKNCSMCLAWKHNNSNVTPAVMFNLSNGNLSSTQSVNGTVTNQGIWSCQTIRTSSESAKSIYIKVINVAITGNYTNIRIGSQATVNCTVPLLSSDATIKWITQNGCVVSNTGVLMLSGNHTINNTLLTCSIDSTHQLYTSSQKEILVTVQNTIVSQVSTDSESVVVLLRTQNVKLNCSIELSNQIGPDFSSLLVTWKHNGTATQPKPSLSPQVTGYTDKFYSTLMVSSVDYSNSGNYCCSASLSGSVSSMTNCVFLTVSEIRILGDYSDLTVGSTTNITCDVLGLISSVVSWTRSWSGATSTSNTLMLTSVDSTLDGVNFTCAVSSNQLYTPGEKMITVTVKDTRISMVAIEPNNIVALSTGRTHADITCTVTLSSDIGPNYAALSVFWMTNSPDDSKVQPLTGAAKDEFTRTLTIPLTNTDQRNYCCNASLVGNATTVSACSTVKILDIQIGSNFQNLTLGSSTSISCSVPNLANSSIRWLSQDEQMVITNSDILVLETVNYTIDGTTFRCSVNSSQLYSPGGKNITVTVLNTSVFAVTIDEDRVAALKGTKNITFICSVTLSAPIGPVHKDLNVTWKHDGSQLAAAEVVGNGMITSLFNSILLLYEVEFSDDGSYCCVASVIGSGTENQMDCVTLSVLDIVISGNFTDLTVGSTSHLICSVPGLETGDKESSILWRRTDTLQMTSISTPANATLTLQSVDSMLNGSVLTCSVNSTQLYSSESKNITVTVKHTYVDMVSVSEVNLMVPVVTQTHIISCTITLSSAIGPDHSALSVTWQHNNQLVSHDRVHVFPTQGVSNVFYSNLTLHQVSEHDGGVYNCAAGLTGNETKTADHVELQVTSLIMISGNYINLRIGSTVELQCKAPMLSNSTIMWLSQNGSIVNSSAVLIIKSVTYSINVSMFKCSVNSSQLTNSINRTIMITIEEAAVSYVTIVNPPSYVADGGRNVELQCTVTLSHHIGPDYRALIITWTHTRNIVHNCPHPQPHGNTQISNTFTCNLTLATVSATSAGLYVCSGEVIGSNVLQVDSLNLKVEGSLQSANLHTPENAVLGQSSVLTCEVNTSLPVTISLLSVQWMHNGNVVTTTSSGFVLKQGGTSVYVTELTLSETTVEQSGLYSCNVSLDTDRQQLTAKGNLTVSFSHVDVLVTPSDGFPTQPLLGNNTRLNCSVILHPQLNSSFLNNRYKWSSNGVQRGSGHELVLSDLSLANATTYSCQVMILSTVPGQAMIRQISIESNYTLVIKMPAPSVQRSPSESRTILYIGEDVSITCTSNVTGVVFTWRAINSLNQQPVVISNITTHPTPHSSVFKPTVVDAIIVDVFCSVMIAGNDNIVAGEAFSFIQLILPVWSVSVSSNASMVLDISDYNSFTVMCGATFMPSYIPRGAFTFLLTKNNEPVTDTLSIDPVISPSLLNTTQYSSVQQTASSGPDTLVYNCTVVFNINGSHITTDSSTTQVTVKGPSLPAAPVVHQPPVTSPTSALIQWSVPEVTYSPEQYTVYYTTNSSSCPDSDEGYNKSVTVYGLNHTEFYTIRDQQYNVTLNNLHPHTVYCYKVVVTNTVGRNESVLSSLMTNESVPSGPPKNTKVTLVTSHTLNLSWLPPLLSQRNGVITSYIISCSSSNRIVNTTRTSSTSLTITGLEPFTNYTCSVSAATTVGNGPTVTIHTMTNEDIPETSVANYFLSSQNSTSVIIDWTPPVKPNGIIIEYQLQCFGEEQEYRWTVRGSQTTTTLSGLLPYTNYSCSITAHTSVGGGPAQHISVLSDEDIPGRVKDIVITPHHSSTQLIVRWLPPEMPNGILTGYELNVSTSTNTVYYDTDIKPNDNMRTVTSLSPYIPYYVSVAASTSIGKGDVKTKVAFTEQEVPVTGPHDIHVKRFSSSQIIVSWRPLSLEEARGFITKYTVTAEPTTLTRRRQEGMLSVSVEHDATRVVLDGLSPFLAYSVSVSASTTVGTSSNNNITIVGALVCPPPTSTSYPACTKGVSEVTVSVVTTFILTCLSTLVVAVLVTVLVMRKCQNKPANKARNQHYEEPEGMYEMVDTVKTAEAEYEVVDHERKEVVLEENPAYAMHSPAQ